jgi:hypothetical protein
VLEIVDALGTDRLNVTTFLAAQQATRGIERENVGAEASPKEMEGADRLRGGNLDERHYDNIEKRY